MALQIPNGEQQFLDGNGNPLAAGTVGFYIPTTLNFKNTWQDEGQSILNINPVQLDASGRAIIYGTGAYRQIVKDSLGNVIWDQLTYGQIDFSVVAAGDLTGSANVLVATPSAPVSSYTDGLIVTGKASATNNAAVTLAVSGLAAKSVTINALALVGGEIQNGLEYGFIYDPSTDTFHLLSWESPSLGLNTFHGAQNFAKGTDIASAATTDLGAATGNFVHVTGNVGITALGTIQAGTWRQVTFTGTPTITHNAASLILPGGLNIVAAAGDCAIFVSEGAGNWRCLSYVKASGGPVIGERVLQTVSSETGAVATGATVMFWDDTVPQITEGDQYLSLAITPISATSTLVIDVSAVVASSAVNNTMVIALFQDATAGALAARAGTTDTASASLPLQMGLKHIMVSGTTSATTFRVRIGGTAAGTTTFNGAAGARKFGGVSASSITITEYA